jgi:hypothetical protein|nr:MAG TPA: protein of unknown function (DUF4519) [Caudoviricetes sp.]
MNISLKEKKARRKAFIHIIPYLLMILAPIAGVGVGLIFYFFFHQI